MVELKDGTRLVQTRAINNFISYKYGFTPESAFKRYTGEQVLESLQGDFQKQLVRLFTDKDNAASIMDEICDTHFPKWLESFDKNLNLQYQAFICGDTLTLYDFEIGGFFLNTVYNPNSPHKEKWEAAMKKHSTMQINQYIANF